MDWQAAAKRRDVAEWRDRHLLAAAMAVNGVAVDAAAAVERNLARASRVDPLLDPFKVLRLRLDGELRRRMEVALSPLLNVAARELRAIDPRTETAALGLLREGWPPLPPEPTPTEPDGSGEPRALDGYRDAAVTFGRGVARADRSLIVESVRAGARTSLALAEAVRRLSGFRDRSRDQARGLAVERLLVGGPDHPAALPHIEAALDAAAAMAKGELA